MIEIYKPKNELVFYVPNDIYIKDSKYNWYYLILNEIYCRRKWLYNKYKDDPDSLYHEGWVSLNSTKLQRLYTRYYILIKDLIKWKIIEVLESYKVGVYSKNYRINPEHLVKDKNNRVYRKVIIKDLKILKKVNKNKFTYYVNSNHYSIMLNALENVNIREDDARLELEELFNSGLLSIEAFNILNGSIDALINKELYFKIDSYGRLHTNITTLKKCMRKHLYFNENFDIALVNVDIVNCQPFLLSLLFNKEFLNHISDIFEIDGKKILNSRIINQLNSFKDIEYINLVSSGKFYECIMEKTGLSREDIKRNVYIMLFSKYVPEKIRKFFNNEMPDFLIFLDNLKNARNDIDNFLPKLLQKLESYLMIIKISEYLIDNNFTDFVTIHDSILVEDHNKQIIVNAIHNIFNEFNLQLPPLNIE